MANSAPSKPPAAGALGHEDRPAAPSASRPLLAPEDSGRAAANQARLTDRNLRIAGEVDRAADELG
jgi:hypothetical protein